MRALLIFVAMILGGAFGMVAPVLVAIAIKVAFEIELGSGSYEDFIPIVLVTMPLFAIAFPVLANLWFSRRVARVPR